jgi:hypothetical protein
MSHIIQLRQVMQDRIAVNEIDCPRKILTKTLSSILSEGRGYSGENLCEEWRTFNFHARRKRFNKLPENENVPKNSMREGKLKKR